MSVPRHGPLVVIVGLALAAVAAAVAGLPAKDTVQLVALSAGAGFAVWVVGHLAIRRRQQPVVVALIPVAGMLLGTLVAARAMFVSQHDLSATFVVAIGAGTAGVLGALSLAQELDAARRRVEAMAERERAMEHGRRELVAWVSHDLRTPLAGIRAMVEALDDGVVSEPAEVTGFHRRLTEETDRLAKLVDDLFELSRIEADALALTLERVSLGELVSDAVAAAAAVAEAKDVRIDGRVDGSVDVAASARELTRAVRNLLDNAIRHTPPGGAVRVEVGAGRDGQLEVSVLDACGGIPDDEIDRLFDLGYRGDGARTPGTDGGAGLGLAIAKGFVEAHRGRIEVRNVGAGCRFTVHLPALADA
jgi:signal transduction histidine kinase